MFPKPTLKKSKRACFWYAQLQWSSRALRWLPFCCDHFLHKTIPQRDKPNFHYDNKIAAHAAIRKLNSRIPAVTVAGLRTIKARAPEIGASKRFAPVVWRYVEETKKIRWCFIGRHVTAASYLIFQRRLFDHSQVLLNRRYWVHQRSNETSTVV